MKDPCCLEICEFQLLMYRIGKKQLHSGLSFRAGGQGFLLATMNVVPGHFCREIEENKTKRNP